jgi:hypothetical protein
MTQQPFGRRRPEPPRRQSPMKLETRAPEPAPVFEPVAAPAAEPEPSRAEPALEFAVPRPPTPAQDRGRRRRKRWLAEPYRSFSIAASIGFGISSFILPDSIQNVVQLVMGILTVGGLAAGFRSSYLADHRGESSRA